MAEAGTVLNATLRNSHGTAAARKLRREGLVPAVIYGHKQETVAIILPQKELAAAIRSGVRTMGVVVEGKEERTLIKEAQFDPLSLDLLHVDFARVALDERVTVSVPIVTSGTPKATAEGGVLDLVLKELEVECLVTNIPAEIKIKVGEMQIGDGVLVRDLELPPGVVVSADVAQDATVVAVHAPRKGLEEEVAEVTEVESAEPEVISEKEREERAEAKEEEKDEREKKEKKED